MRVLVVDDQSVERLALASAVEEFGYEVEVAENGAEAYAIHQKNPAQIVIADWMMPVMDGIELCKRIRRSSTDSSYTYVILLSSRDGRDDRLAGLKAGADDFLIKPLDRGELFARLGVASRILRMEAALRDANDKVEQTRKNEIEIGAHIQRTLLMARPPEGTSSFEFAAMNLPSSQIDGDFFDFFVHHPDIVDVFVGDSMGKGVPAALIGAGTKSFMLRSMNSLLAEPGRMMLPRPEEIVQRVHDGVSKELIRLNSFVTLIYARLDATDHMATFVDCGHTKVIHFSRETGKASTIEGSNFPIGFTDEEEYVERMIPFGSDDIFCFYSDGVTEAKSDTEGLYGVDRLIRLIEQHHRESPTHLLFRLREAVRTYTNNMAFDDDFTCVIVRTGKAVSRWEARDATFGSSLNSLEDIRQFVGASALDCGLDGTQIDALQLAAHEAVTNVIRHAHRSEPGNEIALRAERLLDGVRLSIIYDGEAFAPSEVSEPDIYAMPESGLGLFIIERSVDELEYSSDPLNGRNIVRMTKRNG